MKKPERPSESALKDALGVLAELPCSYTAEMGGGTETLDNVIKWRTGTVVPLNRPGRAKVTIQVAGRAVAAGTVVIVDGKLAVRIDDVLTFASQDDATKTDESAPLDRLAG